jgi:hypothetical protein
MTNTPRELSFDHLDHVSGGLFSIIATIHQMAEEAGAKSNQATSDATTQMALGIVSGVLTVGDILRHRR